MGCQRLWTDAANLFSALSRGGMIELESVSKKFGAAIALHETDLRIEAGRTTVLIGPAAAASRRSANHWLARADDWHSQNRGSARLGEQRSGPAAADRLRDSGRRPVRPFDCRTECVADGEAFEAAGSANADPAARAERANSFTRKCTVSLSCRAFRWATPAREPDAGADAAAEGAAARRAARALDQWSEHSLRES